MIDSGWEGYHESRRCSRDTYPESDITKYTSIRRLRFRFRVRFRVWKLQKTHIQKQQLLHKNVQRFRGGLVFKAYRLCVSLNSRRESNEEEEDTKTSEQCQSGDS